MSFTVVQWTIKPAFFLLRWLSVCWYKKSSVSLQLMHEFVDHNRTVYIITNISLPKCFLYFKPPRSVRHPCFSCSQLKLSVPGFSCHTWLTSERPTDPGCVLEISIRGMCRPPLYLMCLSFWIYHLFKSEEPATCFRGLSSPRVRGSGPCWIVTL